MFLPLNSYFFRFAKAEQCDMKGTFLLNSIPKWAHSFWAHSTFNFGHIPKRANSILSTFQKGQIPFWAHSKMSTFKLGYIPKTAHSKKEIPFWSHYKKGTYKKSTFHFDQIPKKVLFHSTVPIQKRAQFVLNTFKKGLIPKNSTFQKGHIQFWADSIKVTFLFDHIPKRADSKKDAFSFEQKLVYIHTNLTLSA